MSCGSSESGFVYKTCTRDAECNSRLKDCERIASSTIGLCSVRCQADEDCEPEAACVDLDEPAFDRSCVKRCTSDDCPAGMSCFQYDIGSRGCFPSTWLG